MTLTFPSARTHAPLYLAFTGADAPSAPVARAVGPFFSVEFRGAGIWGYDGTAEGVRVATRAPGSGAWQLDGLGADEPSWSHVEITCPSEPTTAAAIEAAFAATRIDPRKHQPRE